LIWYKVNAVDFESAAKTVNNLLIEKQPETFNSSWVHRERSKTYRNKAKVKTVLRKYHDKLYTFVTPADKNDKDIRDKKTLLYNFGSVKLKLVSNFWSYGHLRDFESALGFFILTI
jgi:hypothetical protein